MDQNQQFENQLYKAAALGYTQSLLNLGYNEQQAMQKTAHYLDSQNGTIVKRAARVRHIVNTIDYALRQLQAQG